MKIYFDISTLNPKKVTGVGVYMLQLLHHFSMNNELEVVPSLKLSRLKNKKRIESILPQKKAQLLAPYKLFSEKQALYHGPDFKLNLRGGMPRVVTIHDMVVFAEKFNRPEFYQKGIKDMTRVLNSSSLSAVIVNSEFTKNEVLRFFPHLKERIHVTYLGCNRSEFPASSSNTLNLPEKYILFLGTLEKRKNVVGVIRAFEILKKQGFQEKLVLAGAWGFGEDEIQTAIETSPAKDHIVHLNYVSNEQLQELYRRAQVFFFPSLYEGFGIPVLEAMSANCPVVASSGGALEEICADAALHVDPNDPQIMARAVSQVLHNQSLAEELRQKGSQRIKKFTWEQCALDTIKVYKEVLRKS